ncbi:MAG TPA: MFS transporter, partial [Burkholderiaceae bacterium]|nr:MFS transporter [Burkholderiaceae bacterium]
MLTPIRSLVGLTILTHAAFGGSRVAVSLAALELQASPFAIGLLLSFYGLLPMFLSVPAGRWIDRVGMRLPMVAGCALLGFGVAVPFLIWDIGALYLASVTEGVGFMAFHLAVQKAAGLVGGIEARTSNFSLLALGFSVSGFLGPTLTGLAIDAAGHRWSFALLALAPLCAIPALRLVSFVRDLGEPARPARATAGEAADAPPTRL